MIEIKKLKKSYGENLILDNFNLTVNPGDFMSITGPSGCGKSTLLNIIGLIDGDYEGNVEINGVDIQALKGNRKQKFIRENINYMFQNFALIEDKSVMYNLELALNYTNLSKVEKANRIQQVLESVNLHQKAKSPIYALSGGEQQRVALSRCLIKPGKIIIADEPTGNLDDTNRDMILDILINNHRSDQIVVIVTHDPHVVARCQNHVVLK